MRSHFWSGVRDNLYEKVEGGGFRATSKLAETLGLRLGEAEESAEVEPPRPQERSPRSEGDNTLVGQPHAWRTAAE